MMELSHSLVLNESALGQIAEAKRPVFVFEWLRFLDKVLVAAQKSDIKGCQQKLVEQLTAQMTQSPGPPTRKLLGRCLATLFSVGDPFALFETINKCNDILKNKDDSPSYLPTRLSAIASIGAMYEKLGRMVGRSFEETVQVFIKSLKNAESQGRCEIMLTLQKIVSGLGYAASSVHKDIYKAARNCMTDRVMSVRCAASKCLQELVKEAPFLYITELENMASLCFRAFDGSNYDVRCAVANLLGNLLASAVTPKPTVGRFKVATTEEILNILSTGFLRGGMGFLKGGAGEMIKGAGVSREVRVGVTHSYVVFVQTLGGLWLERNASLFLNHVLELVANPRALTTHVDAVYSRKCVSFILRSIFGSMLGEKAQISTCRELCQTIIRQMRLLDSAPEHASNGKDGNFELSTSQHILISALQELGSLVQGLGTIAGPLVAEPNNNIIDPVFSVLIHPSPAARFAAAWCLRCIAVAVPSQLTPLLERCIDRLESLKSSPEAISGYSAALAALIGGVYQCPLGIPHSKGKQIFNIAEDLLRTASQSSRLSIQRTQAGWLLVGAFMTLGPPVVRSQVPRLLLLWKNAFPRSTKELESEKARGDAFTWQVTLEGRAGALSAMHSFVSHCQELVTEDVIRRLLSPIEAALLMLANTSSVIKSYGQHLKAGAATVRLRLYQTLSRLPPETFEGSYSSLLRELVAEFTLTENPANTTTSLLRSMCHQDDSVILGSWLQETDHKAVEDQMEPNRRLDRENLQPNSASGSGALEHDPATLYTRLPWGENIPGPLPLGVAVIDSSVALYGQIFPRVAYKHRLQMLEHFAECIKQTKSSRQQAVQINIFTAVLSALKCLAETKTSFGQNDIRRAANNLVMSALTNSNPILRCAAGEALGRMAQVVGDSRFTAEMAQHSFDRLKSARDVVSRTGHSLALGCLHRYVGGMCSGQHLNTSVSILLALAQDTTSPIVQVWSLHALALIADSGGPMFRGYFEPTLSLALKLLLNVSPANTDVHQCIAKCLSALITTVGPELQGNTGALCTARSSFLVACAIMQDHTDSLVQAEAITCLQQLHMFAPRHVNLSTLVPHLCRTLSSSHLLLRRAAVACLRQLSQREAREVCDHALTLVADNKDRSDLGFTITESGLPGILFGMLDTETDRKLSSDIHDTLTSMLQSLAGEHLQQWLTLCKDVLATSSDASSTPDENTQEGDAGENIEEDDVAKFHAGEEIVTHPTVAPRWPTRVFAIDCVQKILSVCDGNKVHFDLVLAKEMKLSSGKVDFLVLHLSDLVRMAFMAATSDSDQLRLAGLTALQEIINKFAKVPEPEFPGHVILEQFQAQVGAALRPAFSPDTPSHVTAMACQVCSSWIGSGVARDLNDLRRVHQLLVSSLTKLKKGTSAAQLFSESASTLEKLSILKAWAEVYIVAMQRQVEEAKGEREDEVQSENLLSLVSPELVSLSKHWLAALKDHALLSLPTEFGSQLPPEGGAFYSVETIETARPYYRCSWPPILYAASLWLNNGGFDNISDEKEEVNVSGSTNLGLGAVNAASSKNPEEINTDRFHLIFGICMEALCSPRAEEPVECVTLCLQSLCKLLDSAWARSQLGRDPELSVELLNVLHRLLLTRELPAVQLLVMEVVKQVIKSAHENLELQKKQLLKESVPANQEPKESDLADTIVGEGGENGEINPGKSIVFATLEICLCVLIRQLPVLNPILPSAAVQSASKAISLSNDGLHLLSSAVTIMADLPSLCSPAGSTAILPSILYLTTGVLREMAQQMLDLPSCSGPVSTALHSLRTLAASPFTRDPRCSEDWIKLLQSALAAILDVSKAGSEDNKIDDVSMMLAVAVFIISAPWQVTSAINLQYPCINMFKRLVQSEKANVQLKCLQTLRSIFQHPDRIISTPYIHALAPRIIESLHTHVTCPSGDITNVTERVQIMETLVSLSEDCNRIHLMSLLVPLLISFLQDTSKLSSVNYMSSELHDFALQQLMIIGPMYPQQFRQIMTSNPDLRNHLEAAIRVNQANSKSSSSNTTPSPTLHVPTIQLKMDFVANFTG